MSYYAVMYNRYFFNCLEHPYSLIIKIRIGQSAAKLLIYLIERSTTNPLARCRVKSLEMGSYLFEVEDIV